MTEENQLFPGGIPLSAASVEMCHKISAAIFSEINSDTDIRDALEALLLFLVIDRKQNLRLFNPKPEIFPSLAKQSIN